MKSVKESYSSSSDHNDIVGFLQQLNSILDSIVLRKLLPLGELTRYGDGKKWVKCLIRGILEEGWRYYPKGSAELLGGDSPLSQSILNKSYFPQLMQTFAIRDCFLQSTCIRHWKSS